jgi:regulatory protein
MNDFNILLQSALKILAIRSRSRKEISDYLGKKTRDQELKDRVINKLTEMGLIDDAKFAAWLIASRSRSRPRGKRLLLQELKSKGITMTDELITINEAALAQKALEKKLSLWKNLSFRDFRIKAGRYLAARGFSWSTIETVIRKAYNDRDVS